MQQIYPSFKSKAACFKAWSQQIHLNKGTRSVPVDYISHLQSHVKQERAHLMKVISIRLSI